MKNFIAAFNLLGLAALTALCVFQWNQSGELRHRRDELIRKSEALEGELKTTRAALETSNGTVEEFRKRVETLETDNARLAKALKDSETRVAKLTGEVDRLEKTVAAWKAAVTERDAVIETQNKAIGEHIAARKEAREKYDDLVGKYNDLAKRVTEAEKLVLEARAERDRARAELKAVLAANE